MKLLLIIFLGVLLATYMWGWTRHVPDKEMTPMEYTDHYFRDVWDLGLFFADETKKLIQFSEKPISRFKEEVPS